MKAKGRRVGLIFLGLVCLALATLLLLTWRQIRQERLNRALISAVKRNDDKAVVTLLDLGADANCRDEPPRNFSLWQTLMQVVRRKKYISSHAPTPLLVALMNEEMSNPDGTVELRSINVRLALALMKHGSDPMPATATTRRL